MILEAFQAALARHADSIVMMLIGGFGIMAVAAFAAGAEFFRKSRSGHRPSSAGERPEPPRSGSGVQAPVDPLARIARLRAELEDLVFVAQGGDRSPDNPAFMKWTAERLQHHHGENPNQDYVLGLHSRADQLEQALINARRTLEATMP